MRASLIVVLMLAVAVPLAGQIALSYQVRDLGVRPGFSGSVAEGINWLGLVTGSQLTEPVGIPPLRSSCHAFLWNALTRMRDLGTVGTACAVGRYVDLLGRVGGTLSLPLAPSGFGYRSFFWSAATGIVDIGSLAGSPADATLLAAMNARGEIVGFSQEGQYSLGNPPYERAFYWSRAAGMTDLGSLAGLGIGKSRAMAINDSGRIVGSSFVGEGAWSGPFAVYWVGPSSPVVDLAGKFAIPGASQAFRITNRNQIAGVRWQDDRILTGFFIADPAAGPVVEIGTLGLIGSVNPGITAMNAAGQVAGVANISSDPATPLSRGFRWTPPGAGPALWEDVAPLPGDSETAVTAINIRGQVVGTSFTRPGLSRAILWTPATGTVALPPLAAAGECHAADINVLGVISGSCTDPENRQHAVVWTPRLLP